MSYKYTSFVNREIKFGFMKPTGERIILNSRYEYIGKFFDGLALVSKNHKYGFINNKGEEVIPCTYSHIYQDWDRKVFNEGLVGALLNGKWGFIDSSGALIVPIKYDQVYPFWGGFSNVEKDGEWGFVDIFGNDTF